MDIADFKKYAIPRIESGKIVSVVRQTIKEAQNSEQDQYENQKDLYKPIVEKLEREIEEISDLREDMQKTANKSLTSQKKLAITDGTEKLLVDLDSIFSNEDKKTLSDNYLPLPSKVFLDSLSDDTLITNLKKKTATLNKILGRKKKRIEVETIKKYREQLDLINKGKKSIKKGTGFSKYTQPKRNAYKIKENGQYGNLHIDVPQLLGRLKLIAYKDGQKVYDKSVDFDTVDLLTKRFNSKKNYSNLSKTVFDELNDLSQIPIHRTSKKYSALGSGVKYYNNPRDLLDRLELLGGEIDAGNNATKVKNEFSEIAHTLNKLNIFSNTDLENLIKEYII